MNPSFIWRKKTQCLSSEFVTLPRVWRTNKKSGHIWVHEKIEFFGEGNQNTKFSIPCQQKKKNIDICEKTLIFSSLGCACKNVWKSPKINEEIQLMTFQIHKQKLYEWKIH